MRWIECNSEKVKKVEKREKEVSSDE